jgi:hypothetical protein
MTAVRRGVPGLSALVFISASSVGGRASVEVPLVLAFGPHR